MLEAKGIKLMEEDALELNQVQENAKIKLDQYSQKIVNYVREMGMGLNKTSEDYLYYSEFCYSLFNDSLEGNKTLGYQRKLHKKTQTTREELSIIYGYKFAYSFIAFISLLSSTLVALTIYKYKKL